MIPYITDNNIVPNKFKLLFALPNLGILVAHADRVVSQLSKTNNNKTINVSFKCLVTPKLCSHDGLSVFAHVIHSSPRGWHRVIATEVAELDF